LVPIRLKADVDPSFRAGISASVPNAPDDVEELITADSVYLSWSSPYLNKKTIVRSA
jgi:hypothetical protein